MSTFENGNRYIFRWNIYTNTQFEMCRRMFTCLKRCVSVENETFMSRIPDAKDAITYNVQPQTHEYELDNLILNIIIRSLHRTAWLVNKSLCCNEHVVCKQAFSPSRTLKLNQTFIVCMLILMYDEKFNNNLWIWIICSLAANSVFLFHTEMNFYDFDIEFRSLQNFDTDTKLVSYSECVSWIKFQTEITSE